jgi:hypothetical protein
MPARRGARRRVGPVTMQNSQIEIEAEAAVAPVGTGVLLVHRVYSIYIIYIECYARGEAPDWRFSDKRVSIFRPNITPKRLGY